ncbi:hypothetical protein DWZ61_04835 [Clostridium sp. AF34-10BH]|jgi:hypothetical protein|uniref:hypothetical protein n=1 Tax=Clostridium sp. AF34-10BH TaxID=2293011 RepID=UPI000E4F9E64|nr:hypothetical protein [Clostridium sp. AF34-10BH]RHP33027.1 hypothetical protein DWZ61_04835 [Clostridium sp. AF34-10BH]
MDHNFILCLLITFIVLYLIKECFTIHMGPICAYDNTLYFVLLIAVLLLVAIGRSVNIIEFNLPGILLGIVCFLASYIISYVSYRLYDKSNEREYREKRKLVIEDINVDALKEVMKECEESGVDISKKQCNCACKFSDRNPSKEQCLEDTLPTPDKCCPIFGCENAYCSVFNTTVDHYTDCVWCEQNDPQESCKCLCLLSRINENEELKDLVDNINSKSS